jgi:hypothetical protein
MNSDQAIEWALQEGNTTRKGSVPGGLGLKLIREFIAMNKGRIQIVSDRGYWEFSPRRRDPDTHGHFHSPAPSSTSKSTRRTPAAIVCAPNRNTEQGDLPPWLIASH